MIEESGLAAGVKERSIAVFRKVAEAEAKVHGSTVDEVHFHEVGAVDSIVDIVGVALGLDYLGIEAVEASVQTVGGGFVNTQHGVLPVPAPATIEILCGAPVRQAEMRMELTTPTGAGIVAACARRFGTMPAMTVERVGYGAGSRDPEALPNLLRLVIGETLPEVGRDRVLVLEANVDDMSPEFYELAMERLFAAGALDVAVSPLQMKKNRPGFMLHVVAPLDRKEAVAAAVLRETTSIGVRLYEVERRKLGREARTVATPSGEIRVKVLAAPDGSQVITPEWNDVLRVARETGKTAREVYWEAVRGA